MNINSSRLLQFILFTSVVLGLSLFVSSQNSLYAATCVWNGSVNSNWGTNGNWSGCTTPSDGDTLEFPFPNGGENYTSVNNMSAGLDIQGIWVGWNDYEISGNAIDLRGDFIFDDDDNSGVLEWSIDVTLYFDYLNIQVIDESTGIDWIGNISNNTGVDLYKQYPGRLTLSGNNTFNGDTIVQDGILRLASSTALQNSAATVTHPKTIELIGNITISTPSLVLDGNGFYENYGALHNVSGNNTWAGPIDVFFEDGLTWITVDSGTLTLSGVITGDSEIYKNGGGELIISGSSGNTFTRPFTVEEGEVSLNKSSGVAVSSSLVAVGNGIGGSESAILSLESSDQINADAEIFIYSDGLLQYAESVNNNIGLLEINIGKAVIRGTSSLAGLVINGGVLEMLDSSTVSAEGMICNDADGNTARISGVGNFTPTAENFSIDGSIADATERCEFLVPITGSSNIWIGAKGVSFKANNTYTGDTIINPNTRLNVSHANGLGNSASGTVVENGGVLALIGGITIANEPLQITGLGGDFGGALTSASGTNVYGGPITIAGAEAMFVQNGDAILTISGGISGSVSGNVIFQRFGAGSGVIQLSTANTYSAAQINLQDVTLRKSASVNAFPDTISVWLNQWSTLDLNSFSETLGSLSNENSNSAITLGNATLSVGANNGTSTFSGIINGAGGVSKVGTGTFTLTANNGYTGTTTVAAGRLNINGQQAGSAVTLSGTGVLGGTGRVGVITGGGTGGIAPGTSPGILNVTGNVVFANTNSFNVEINGTTVGSQYDQLNVTGAVNLNSATLNVALGMSTTVGQTFTIIQASSALVGTFNGLPNNSTFTVGSTIFRINYGSNSAVLTVTTGGSGGGGGDEDGGGGLSETGIAVPLAALGLLSASTGAVVGVNKYKRKRRKATATYR